MKVLCKPKPAEKRLLNKEMLSHEPKGEKSKTRPLTSSIDYFYFYFIGAFGVVILSLQKHSKVTRLVHWYFILIAVEGVRAEIR
jgi:hypothetical protein